MTQNLKSIPEEDCRAKSKIPTKGKLKMRINSAFGFAMNQFKAASSIKPIRNTKTLSITERGGVNSSTKRRRIKGKSATSQGFFAKSAYTKNSNLSTKGSQNPKTARKVKVVQEVKQAKNIFITGTEEQNTQQDPEKDKGSPVNSEHKEGKNSSNSVEVKPDEK